MLIRPSIDADIPAITAIYGEHVLHGTGSFELEPPGEPEMARRRTDLLAKGMPWLVAQSPAQGVLGYAYASLFRPRPGYRFTAEDSIYLHPGAQGQGLGRLLLAELMARCQDLGIRQMLAVIGDAANTASITLHRNLGFAHCGTLSAVGWKFERWRDVVMMQRALGVGSSSEPADR